MVGPGCGQPEFHTQGLRVQNRGTVPAEAGSGYRSWRCPEPRL